MQAREQEARQPYAETAFLQAALAGDHAAFEQITAPYQRELLVHCYRILGSLEDAEDILQETWLRAWRRLATFEGRAPFRAWLYKIATHTALDAQESRRRRVLPMATHAPADPFVAPPAPSAETLWLEPIPSSLLPLANTTPETAYEAHENVSLAFLAALQHLPGRQRAVLILREVLDWQAMEVAELLDMTVAAVNSALQRARATMKAQYTAFKTGSVAPAGDVRMATLLQQYVQAWETADATRMVALLRHDAVLTMPPVPAWYSGSTSIQKFLTTHLFKNRSLGDFHLILTQANGCPAFATYLLDEAGVYQATTIQVLTIVDHQIIEIHGFIPLDGKLFARFDLPPSLSLPTKVLP